MPTFISLQRWTRQGRQTFDETPARADRLAGLLEQLGGELRSIHWTMGPYDVVVVFEAPDIEAASAAILALTSSGNAEAVTMPAFDRDGVADIIARVGR